MDGGGAFAGDDDGSFACRAAGLPYGKVYSRRIKRGIPRIETPPRCRIDDSLLGTQTDGDLAKIWGLSPSRVANRRLQLGIPSYHSTQRRPLPDEWLLGTRTDKELATIWGTSVSRVACRRIKLGIPSFRATRRRLNEKAVTSNQHAITGTDDTQRPGNADSQEE
jgi:hypothetical protein